MLLSILLVVGVVSSNDTGYEGECLEEVVTLRRKVRLMETLHKQMEEKGKRLTLEHELLERDLQKKTEEVEELREAMRQAEEELPLSSAGTDKEKVRDLQGKVGALQLKVGMVSTQLERCSTQVKILLNGTEPEETPEQRRRRLPHYACEVDAADINLGVVVDALYSQQQQQAQQQEEEEEEEEDHGRGMVSSSSSSSSSTNDTRRSGTMMQPMLTRDLYMHHKRYGKNRFGERCTVEKGDLLVGGVGDGLRMTEHSIQELVAMVFSPEPYQQVVRAATVSFLSRLSE